MIVPAPSKQDKAPYRRRPRPSRTPALVITALVALVIAGLGGGGTLWILNRSREKPQPKTNDLSVSKASSPTQTTTKRPISTLSEGRGTVPAEKSRSNGTETPDTPPPAVNGWASAKAARLSFRVNGDKVGRIDPARFPMRDHGALLDANLKGQMKMLTGGKFEELRQRYYAQVEVKDEGIAVEMVLFRDTLGKWPNGVTDFIMQFQETRTMGGPMNRPWVAEFDLLLEGKPQVNGSIKGVASGRAIILAAGDSNLTYKDVTFELEPVTKLPTETPP